MTSARLNVMSDPVTSTVVSEILRVAFGQFLKAGVGEGGRQLTGAALTKADELRKKIYSWFSKAKHKKAEESIRKIEKEGEENSLAKLITYLTDEMEENPRLASELQSYITDIKNLSSTESRQVIAEKVEALEEVELEGIQQKSIGKENKSEQIIGGDIQSSGKVIFRNVTQERGK